MEVQSVLNCSPSGVSSATTSSTAPNFATQNTHHTTASRSPLHMRAESVTDEIGERRKRGPAWKAWEDRALARQVLADDPILNKIGKKEDRWKEVADHLKKAKMDRTWSSCKNRIDKLVTWHREEETRSKQRTGTVEEVDEYLQNMSDIALLFDSVSQSAKVKQLTKDKLAAKKEKGRQIRDASMKGQVCKRDLLQETGKPPGVPRKAPKNQFAKEVSSVLEDLHTKAKEFEKKAGKRRERERQSHQEQQELNRNMRLLIDSQKATNEMMQNWMNVMVQNVIKPTGTGSSTGGSSCN